MSTSTPTTTPADPRPEGGAVQAVLIFYPATGHDGGILVSGEDRASALAALLRAVRDGAGLAALSRGPAGLTELGVELVAQTSVVRWSADGGRLVGQRHRRYTDGLTSATEPLGRLHRALPAYEQRVADAIGVLRPDRDAAVVLDRGARLLSVRVYEGATKLTPQERLTAARHDVTDGGLDPELIVEAPRRRWFGRGRGTADPR